MKKFFLFNIIVVFFITLFCGLGTWQLYRLEWKKDLINEIKIGLSSTPIKYSANQIKNYQRVILSGEYNFEDQIYLYSLNNKGQPGLDVITPFKTLDQQNILINRGWIKKEFKDNPEINIPSKEIIGLLKKKNKKNIFTPDNDVKKNVWFWINLDEIQSLTGKTFNNFIVILENDKINRPKPKKISIDLPNNHLKYAITWYSISISILFYFLYFRKTQ